MSKYVVTCCKNEINGKKKHINVDADNYDEALKMATLFLKVDKDPDLDLNSGSFLLKAELCVEI